MRVRLVFDGSCETAETFLGLLPGDMQVCRLLGVVDTSGAEDIEARARQAAIEFPKVHSKKPRMVSSHGAPWGVETGLKHIMAWTGDPQVN